MTEDAILGKAVAKCLFEGIDVVDPLADERALAKHILVNIRSHAGVRVDTGLASVQSRMARAVRPRQTDRHARLKDTVALCHPLLHSVVAGTIQGVGHRADKLLSRISWQLRIRVQGNDILHGGEHGGIANHERKSVFGNPTFAAAQQAVQGGQLAPLALVSHPHSLFRVPAPRTMKEEEDIGRAAILGVEVVYSGLRKLQQRSIGGKRFLMRVAKVGQQPEVQAFIAIRQEADFQRLDQVLGVLGAAEHGRHYHQRARCRHDAFGEIHLRQGMRRHQQSGQPVRQRHGQLTSGQQRQNADREQPPQRRPDGQGLGQEARAESRGDQRDATQIHRERDPVGCSTYGFEAGKMNFRRSLEFRQAFVDQVEADVPCPCAHAAAGIDCGGGSPCQIDRLAGDFDLRQASPLRYLLGSVAVAIACAEIHPTIDAGRILEQSPLDDARALHELAPVNGAKHPQAADAVADRHLIGGLPLILGLHQLLDRQTRFGQSLLDPGQRQGESRTPSLQAARQFGDESANHWRI